MEEFVARRTKMAETKIAQAEVQAVADVRAAAADAAVKASETDPKRDREGQGRRRSARVRDPRRQGAARLNQIQRLKIEPREARAER